MFSSLWSGATADPHAPNFHPVSSRPDSDLFGELEPKDTEWLATSSGFVTETQTWYNTLDDGRVLMVQVIHSSVGVWYPTIQLTSKLYNPASKEKIWRSVNVSNFVSPPPGLDKRSSKSDQFTITHKTYAGSDYPESYTINANLSDDLQISLEIKRPASMPGFKVGKGPKGGYSYFGADTEKPEGYVIHRFWPRNVGSGHIIHKGQATPIHGPGMFVHAIQGMRPNLVASRWNFANFQSEEHDGVSAILMDFTTTDAYGRKGAGSGFVTVSVGSLVVGGKLALVTTETKWPDEPLPEAGNVMSRAVHLKPAHDPDTGYDAPTEIVYRWAGPSIGSEGPVDATLQVPLGDPSSYNGLIEKVDVLAEIPYVLKTVVNYVAGTKPYIYQWFKDARLVVKGPESVHPGLSEGLTIEGKLYSEATFIS
ncbi:survival factor 1 [Heliocybe sulcata]|uniref:Survival factor 1 n=1 Tax=Heliocybe sulcata TaxID=5364 RepID=A0A5C3MR43_9AGAM|nr:survival factor 1 [Heliocybe sulcata]